MKKLKFTKRSAVALLLVLAIILIGVVSLRTVAEANDDVLLASSVYAERLEKIHWVADALRSLGFENGSDIQKAALAQCGHYWHEQNALYTKALEAEKPKLELLGTYHITAYEWTGQPCADGRFPEVGYTAACNSLPLGTKVFIEGVGERTVHDRGATWHESTWMDLYLGDMSACDDWGHQYRKVYKVVG